MFFTAPIASSEPAAAETQPSEEEGASPRARRISGVYMGITADAISSAASALKRTEQAASKPKEDPRSEMLKFINNKKVCFDV